MSKIQAFSFQGLFRFGDTWFHIRELVFIFRFVPNHHFIFQRQGKNIFHFPRKLSFMGSLFLEFGLFLEKIKIIPIDGPWGLSLLAVKSPSLYLLLLGQTYVVVLAFLPFETNMFVLLGLFGFLLPFAPYFHFGQTVAGGPAFIGGKDKRQSIHFMMLFQLRPTVCARGHFIEQHAHHVVTAIRTL